MCQLTKNLPIQIPGSCWIFRIQGGGFDKGEGKNSGGVETPVGAMYLPNKQKKTFRKANLTFITILPILNFLTDIKIKYNEKIVGYIISQWYA